MRPPGGASCQGVFACHFLVKRHYEQYIDQKVVLTTWEDLGLLLDSRTDEGMLKFRVVVEGFDGQLLMVRGGEEFAERSGVLASQVYNIEPLVEDEQSGAASDA